MAQKYWGNGQPFTAITGDGTQKYWIDGLPISGLTVSEGASGIWQSDGEGFLDMEVYAYAWFRSDGNGYLDLIGAIPPDPHFQSDGEGFLDLTGMTPPQFVFEGISGFSMINPVLNFPVMELSGPSGFEIRGGVPGVNESCIASGAPVVPRLKNRSYYGG